LHHIFGMVLSVLILLYNLRKDMDFITMCDRICMSFETGNVGRFREGMKEHLTK